jgi:tetratricopeptide (TPR) repeat protein
MTFQRKYRLTDPYYGLVKTDNVQMEEETRILIQQRIATAKASLEAAESAGEKVDMQLHLIIAEHERLLGDLVASRESYEAYLALNAVSHVAWNAYAQLLDLMNDDEKAEEGFKKAIELLPSEEYYRDYAEYLAREYPEREVEYKAVIDQAYEALGQTTWTMLALGDWYFAQNNCVLGRDHYEVAQTLNPQDTQLALELQEKYDACKQ